MEQPKLIVCDKEHRSNEFGPSRFHAPSTTTVTGQISSHSAKKLRQYVRDQVPKRPGVYGMRSKTSQIIYIGKAKCLRTRLLSYFREDSRDHKAGKIIAQTYFLQWEQTHHEFSALLRELELIRRHRPRFNVLGQPGRQRYVYLSVVRGPAFGFRISKAPHPKDLAVYGPFVGQTLLREAVRRLNHHFGLRDCPQKITMHYADQKELFDTHRTAKCLRYELQTCLGPCAGYCTRTQYSYAFRQARAFLDGTNPALLNAMQAEMTKAAELCEFERAAVLRDRWQVLLWLSDKLEFLRSARQTTSFVYACENTQNVKQWYLIHGGEVHAVVVEPTDHETALAAQSMIQKVFDPKRSGSRSIERCVDSVLIVTSWFRKYPEAKMHLLTPDVALSQCVMQLNPELG